MDGELMDILLVEDNNADAYLLAEMFKRRNKRMDIHRVIDGYDALDYLHQRNQYVHSIQPDLILLDLNLPRINGYDVLKKVKDTPQLAVIPVVILTTSRDPLDHAQCKMLGADICLSKPYGLQGYEDMVQKLLDWASLRLIRTSGENVSIN